MSTETALRALRASAREWSREFRKHGDWLDADPCRAAELVHLDGVRWLSAAGIPERCGGRPLRLGADVLHGDTAVERVVVLEELARGDLGVLMAAPGPSMSGVLVARLADAEQQQRFYAPFLAQPTWSCFALTEPDHGSDAGALGTRVGPAYPNGPDVLRGTKCYIGNAARAALGVVFARRAPGPLGIGGYLIDATHPGFQARPLPVLGLRGAHICHVDLDDVPVQADDELGRHLPRSRRGIRAAVEVFQQLRPGVAALAVGLAQCALDLLDERWSQPPSGVAERVDVLRHRVRDTRALTVRAAQVVDAGGDGALASVAKARACRLAEEATLDVAEVLGPGARRTDPALDRVVRAARGVEFMEGTRNIQLLTAFQGLNSGRLGAPTGPRASVSRPSVLGQP